MRRIPTRAGRKDPALFTADVYRTMAEPLIVEMLLLTGFAFEMAAREEKLCEVAAALDHWVALGLGYRRDAEGRRLFDPVEVVNRLIWAGLGGEDGFWADHSVPTGRAMTHDIAKPGPNGRLHVSLRRRFAADGAPAGGRLRMPLPLAGPYADDVEITPAIPPGCEPLLSPGRLDVRAAGPAPIEIGATACFRPRLPAADAGALPPAQVAIYLRPNEGLVRVTPRIAALAARLAGRVPDEAALAIFWDYLFDEFCCGAVHYDQVTAQPGCDWALDHGWFDCQLGSSLLVSLCRARGIPARIVGGNFLYRVAPANHFWAEVWLSGRWAPFDLLSWGLSRGGRDRLWRQRFFGALNYRMLTQVLPLIFTGPVGVKFPTAWHMLQTAAEGGVSIGFFHLNGTLIFEDHVKVEEQK